MAENKALKIKGLAREYSEQFYNLHEDQPISEEDEIRCNTLSQLLIDFVKEIEDRGLIKGPKG